MRDDDGPGVGAVTKLILISKNANWDFDSMTNDTRIWF